MLKLNEYLISQKLFRRFCLVMLVLFTLVISSLLYYVPSAVKDYSEQAVIAHATKTLKQFSILRQYYTDSVVQKVTDSTDYVISHNHKNMRRAIPLPATMIKDLSGKYRQLDLEIMLYSPYKFSTKPIVELNPSEQKIWQFLNKSPQKIYNETDQQSGKTIMKVALADIMTSINCVNCHNNHPLSPKTDWKMGDVRGVLQMNVDISQQVAQGKSLAYNIIAALLALLAGVLSLSYVIIEKEKLELKLFFNATHDALTGLSNRFIFTDRLELAMKVIKRENSRAVLFYIDLDDFKKINDEYGHDAGDHVLKVVAKRLIDISRETDTVARLGGDEFVILYCYFDGIDFIQQVAKRINESIAEPFIYKDNEFSLSCSIGIAIAPDDIDNAADLVKMSDTAMYYSKRKKHNSFHIYSK